MHTIDLFIHILTYSNSSRWPPSESIQRAAHFLLWRRIFLKASSSMFSSNLLTRRRRSHMFLGFSFFTYCVHWLQKEEIRGERSGEYGGQWCCVLRDMIRSPNFDRENDKHYAVTWQLAPSCWNQYSFLVATC